MDLILKWQYDQLIKEFLLLQEHMSDKSCACATGGEMCVRKHLMTIEAYAQETMSIEKDPAYQEKLDRLANEARNNRENEEKRLCGHEAPEDDLLNWSRKWRKEFEHYSLACENIKEAELK